MLQANVLVLGKSGAGKSSLLNYLWGDIIAKTGAGRPVTERSSGDATGIYPSEPLRVDEKLDLVIYDSWGMEADKADEWNAIIRKESEKRERSSKIEDWFHAVIYCVSAKGARIEEYEIRKVVQPLIDDGHAVIFVLTKCGVASSEETQRVRETIQDACPSHGGIIEVESVPVTLRGRTTPTETSGKEDLLNAVKDNLVSNLGTKLRKKYLAECEWRLDQWKQQVLSFYDEKASYFVPSAMTFSEVSERAVSLLHACLGNLDKWRDSHNAQALQFQRIFGSVLLQQPKSHGLSYFSGYSVLGRGDLKWEGADHAASVVMNFIPVLNVAYWALRKDMHRSRLSDRLDVSVSELRQLARK